MTPHDRRMLIEQFTRMVEAATEDLRITFYCPAIEDAPKDGWKVFKPGPNLYTFIAQGPKSDTEDEVNEILRRVTGTIPT